MVWIAVPAHILDLLWQSVVGIFFSLAVAGEFLRRLGRVYVGWGIFRSELGNGSLQNTVDGITEGVFRWSRDGGIPLERGIVYSFEERLGFGLKIRWA